MKKKGGSNKLAEQLQKRKERQRAQEDSGIKEEGSQWDQEPILKLPEFFDLQDFVNPVFRLELTITNSTSFSSNPGAN